MLGLIVRIVLILTLLVPVVWGGCCAMQRLNESVPNTLSPGSRLAYGAGGAGTVLMAPGLLLMDLGLIRGGFLGLLVMLVVTLETIAMPVLWWHSAKRVAARAVTRPVPVWLRLLLLASAPAMLVWCRFGGLYYVALPLLLLPALLAFMVGWRWRWHVLLLNVTIAQWVAAGLLLWTGMLFSLAVGFGAVG